VLDPSSRLVDFATIKQHPFFEGIDWDSIHMRPVPFEEVFPVDQRRNDLAMLIHTTQKVPLNDNRSDTFLQRESRGEIIHSGHLKKTNRIFIKKQRFFTLANDGEVKYYLDGRFFRGSFWLTKDTECVKTSKTTFEVRIPARTYFLVDIEGNQSNIDIWVEKILMVIQSL